MASQEDIVYFGDTARIPYGTRSNETVIRYSEQCIRFLKPRYKDDCYSVQYRQLHKP